MMAATAAILVGCDWGGAGDGTWNDAYSWANFSGTYNLTQAIEGGSSKYVPKTEPGVSAPSKSSSTGGRVDSSAVKVGPIEAGSVSIRVVSSDGDQKWAYTDDGSDTLEAHGDTAGEATFIHKTGVWSIKLKSGTSFASGDKIIISYNFIGSQSDSGNPKDNGAITITWLNVNQQGNVFTFTDNMGVVYSGKITGASMPGSGYTVAGNVRLSFEVSAVTST